MGFYRWVLLLLSRYAFTSNLTQSWIYIQYICRWWSVTLTLVRYFQTENIHKFWSAYSQDQSDFWGYQGWDLGWDYYCYVVTLVTKSRLGVGKLTKQVFTFLIRVHNKILRIIVLVFGYFCKQHMRRSWHFHPIHCVCWFVNMITQNLQNRSSRKLDWGKVLVLE